MHDREMNRRALVARKAIEQRADLCFFAVERTLHGLARFTGRIQDPRELGLDDRLHRNASRQFRGATLRNHAGSPWPRRAGAERCVCEDVQRGVHEERIGTWLPELRPLFEVISVASSAALVGGFLSTP